MGRTVFAWTIGVVYTLFWSSVGIITWPFSPRGELYLSLARTWSRWILATLRIPFSVESQATLESDQPYIFMSNHRSVFDIFALFLATEHSLRMVAKRALFFIPIFGWALWMCRFIPIDRSDHEKAIKSLENAARKIDRDAPPTMEQVGLRILHGLAEHVRHDQFYDVDVLIVTLDSRPL